MRSSRALVFAVTAFSLPLVAAEPAPDYRAPPPWANAAPANIEAPAAAYKTALARTAMKTILARGVGVALAQTATGDAFAPIAVVVDAKGKEQLVLSEAHVQKQAGEVDLLAQRDTLIANVKKLRPTSAAVFADANVTLPSTGEKVEAVVASFEHADGTCLTVVVPYDRVGGAVKQRAPLSMGGDCSASMLK